MRLPAKILVVLATGLLVAALAVVLQDVRSPSSTADAVLVATPTGTGSVSGDADAAVQLAELYSAVIPRDPGILAAVGDELGQSSTEARDNVSARRVSSSSVISVTVTGTSAGRTQDALEALLARTRRPGAESGLDARAISVLSQSRAASQLGLGRYRSRADLRVSANGLSAGGSPVEANRLAANYAGLIPEDSAVIRAAAETSGLSMEELRAGLSITSDANTALVRISMTSSSYDEARTAVLAVVEALTSSPPASRRIAPASLDAARLPEADGAITDSTAVTAIAGGLLGLLLGGLVVAVLDRRRRRLRTATEASQDLGRPATDLRSWDPVLGASLLHRWQGLRAGDRTVVVASTAPELDRLARELADAFADLARSEGDAGAGAFVSRVHADAHAPYTGRGGFAPMVVLVARAGQPLQQLEEHVSVVEGAGGDVRWTFVAPKGDIDDLTHRVREASLTATAP